MEIHSSSIRIYPAGVNRPKVDQLSAVQNNLDQDNLQSPEVAKRQSKDPEHAAQTPNEIEQTLEQENLQFYPTPVQNDATSKPFNLRIQQALNAYSAQLNQPIFSQRSELISGVDFYV